MIRRYFKTHTHHRQKSHRPDISNIVFKTAKLYVFCLYGWSTGAYTVCPNTCSSVFHYQIEEKYKTDDKQLYGHNSLVKSELVFKWAFVGKDPPLTLYLFIFKRHLVQIVLDSISKRCPVGQRRTIARASLCSSENVLFMIGEERGESYREYITNHFHVYECTECCSHYVVLCHHTYSIYVCIFPLWKS